MLPGHRVSGLALTVPPCPCGPGVNVTCVSGRCGLPHLISSSSVSSSGGAGRTGGNGKGVGPGSGARSGPSPVRARARAPGSRCRGPRPARRRPGPPPAARCRGPAPGRRSPARAPGSRSPAPARESRSRDRARVQALHRELELPPDGDRATRPQRAGRSAGHDVGSCRSAAASPESSTWSSSDPSARPCCWTTWASWCDKRRRPTAVAGAKRPAANITSSPTVYDCACSARADAVAWAPVCTRTWPKSVPKPAAMTDLVPLSRPTAGERMASRTVDAAALSRVGSPRGGGA